MRDYGTGKMRAAEKAKEAVFMEGSQWRPTGIRVRYKDTDRMGVVYYGNYLTFFEVGRAEFMRELGFPYSDLENRGYTLAVTDASVKFHANVGYDALITVMTRISGFTRVRVRFEYRVVDEAGRLLVTGETGHACLDGRLKATRLPRDLMEVLQGNGPGNFDELAKTVFSRRVAKSAKKKNR